MSPNDCSVMRPQTEQQEQMTNLKECHLTTGEQPRDPKPATLCYQLRVVFDKRAECSSSQCAQRALSMHSSCSEPNGTSEERGAVTALIKSLH